MKPFLLVATRPHDGAAQGEYDAVRRFAGLDAADLAWLRLDQAPLGEIDLTDFSGILLGGSGFNISEPHKSEHQLRVEADIDALLERILSDDLPFLGLCYGIGALTAHLGGLVDDTYAEPVVAVDIHPTGVPDPLLDGLEDGFRAFVGHKEGCTRAPEAATILATGDACPIQMYRVQDNVYATQFHPELDAEGLVARMVVYQNSGYFRPEELDTLAAAARDSGVDGRQHLVLRNFVRRYARTV